MLTKSFNFLLPAKVKNLTRLGRNFDGGYLVCEDTLNKCKNLITFGVGDDTSFERDFHKLKKPNNIHLYDYTVNYKLFFYIILKYLRRFITLRATASDVIYNINNFLNFKKFIAQSNVRLFKEKVVSKIKEKNDVNLDTVFLRLNNNSNNLVKIDIEGSEYEIIDKLMEFHSNIEMLIIEFHWINKNKKAFKESIKKLNNEFKIIHLHANNYVYEKDNDYFFDVVEITFLRNGNMPKELNFRYDFPIEGLDYECFPDRPKIAFSFAK
jgi:hypothetical protein